MSIVPLIILVLSVFLFVLPFARPKDGYLGLKKTRTMLGLLIEALGDLGSKPVPSLIVIVSVLGHLMPPVIVWQAVDVLPGRQGLSGLMLMEAIYVLAATCVTFVIIALTYVTFGFSASRSGKTTVVGFALTVMNLLAVVIAVVTVFWPGWLGGLVK